MEKWKRRAIDLIFGLAATDNQSPSVVPYYPQKTKLSSPEKKSLPRTSPEATGVSSLRIANMLAEMEAERRANVHNIMVIKDGCVISEASAPGYDVNIWHLSHSMSKTLTGMAVGLLVDSGELSLNERAADILGVTDFGDARCRDITVEHLLRMSSGVGFSEVGSVTESDWTGAFFGGRLDFEPGERFAYNSMNSYILAKIVCARAKRGLLDFVNERIFLPLGIRNAFWEMGPEGVEKGGWGVYLSAESWAKLGIMMLNGGVYAGKRILSRKWVFDSVTTRSISPDGTGDFNYGYQIWVHRENDEFLFNGMLGQNVWVCPYNNTVVVINAGNDELFQESPALYIMRKYLAGDISDGLSVRNVRILRDMEKRFFESRRHARPLTEKRGVLYKLGFKNASPFPTEWEGILGKYRMRKNNQSLLPVFVRCMQNNLEAGIEELELYRSGDKVYMRIVERGTAYVCEVGLYGFAETPLDFRGEKYIVRIAGEAAYDIEGKPMFRLELVFPEIPNTRFMDLYVTGEDTLLLKFSEAPSNRIAEPLIESLPITNPKLAFLKQLLEKRFGGKFIEDRLAGIFSPSLVLVRAEAENCNFIIDYECGLADADNRTLRSIAAIAARFTRETDAVSEDEDPELEESQVPLGVIGNIFDKIKQFARKKLSQSEEEYNKNPPA